MIGLNTFWDSLPALGNSIISTISNHYRTLMEGKEIPAFHSDEGAWVFRQGKIFLNQENLEAMVDQARPHCDTTFWLGICATLKNYRGWYFKELRKRMENKSLDADDLADFEELSASFEHVAHQLLGKVYRKIKRRYDETTDGLAFYLDEEGELTVNGIRVERFLSLAKRYPTDKSKKFLKGLKDRLSVILSNRQGNPNYDKIHETAVLLFEEIDDMIAATPRLLSAPQEMA